MWLKFFCLSTFILLISCQEATKPFFTEEEGLKRELFYDYTCDDEAVLNSPYANSGKVSGIGKNQAFNICSEEQFLNIGKNPKDWNKHFIIRKDLDFEDELLIVGKNFFPMGRIKKYSDVDPTLDDRTPFTGVIDGRGHFIRRMIIIFDETDDISLGIFPYLADPAEIRNITFEHIKVIQESPVDLVSDITFSGVLSGLSDRGRLENVSLTRAQLLSELNGYTGLISGASVNSNFNKVSVFSSEKISGGGAIGGVTGMIMGGRYSDMNVEIEGFGGTNANSVGGLSGVIIDDHHIIITPVDKTVVSDVEIHFLNSQDLYSDFGGVSASAYSSSFKKINVHIKGFTIDEDNIDVGGVFGHGEKIEINDIVVEHSGDIEVDPGATNCSFIGGAIGDLDDSSLINLSVVGLKSNLKFNLASCDYVGGFSGRVHHSSLRNLKVLGVESFEGERFVGGLIGELYKSSLRNSSVDLGSISASYGDSGSDLTPGCRKSTFLGGAIGRNLESNIESTEVNIDSIISENGSLVGGFAGFNYGNIRASKAYTNIVNGKYYVSGFLGLSVGDETLRFGEVENNHIRNFNEIFGWSMVGGLAGAMGVYLADENSKVCELLEEEIPIEFDVNDYGGEAVFNHVQVGEVYGIHSVSGGVGALINKGKINGLSVNIERIVTRPAPKRIASVDNKSRMLGNIIGGAVGYAYMSSVRNSYVSGEKNISLNIFGEGAVGGFVGKSQESQFYHNFTSLDLFGHANQDQGTCKDSTETIILGNRKTKGECEFECRSPSGAVINDSDNTDFLVGLSCIYPDDFSKSSLIKGLSSEGNSLFGGGSIVPVFGTSSPSDNSILLEGAGECTDFDRNVIPDKGTRDLCLSSFSCINKNGVAVSLSSKEECENYGYCSSGDEYISKEQCCLNGSNEFRKNRWVRNIWTSTGHGGGFKTSDNFQPENAFVKTDNVWRESSENVEVSKIPNVGLFAGEVDLEFDEPSNFINSVSTYHGNFSNGNCFNPAQELIYTSSGEVLREFSNDDSDFYVCEDQSSTVISNLNNQLACERLGHCNYNSHDQITASECYFEVINAGASWDKNQWSPNLWKEKDKADIDPNYDPETCVQINQETFQEKVNMTLTEQEKTTLTTCNDSIVRQLGRQDQFLFSTRKIETDYFYSKNNSPMTYWNFEYFWVEEVQGFPKLIE